MHLPLARSPVALASFPLSKTLTASRLVSVARCGRADHLRTTEELRPVAVDTEPEHLSRGSVVHAGLAAACREFPARPDADRIHEACRAEAVALGLGARDARVSAWVRVAVRAAMAVDWAAWEPVCLPVGFSGEGRGLGITRPDGDAASRIGNDAAESAIGSTHVDVWDGEAGPVLVEHRIAVALPDGPGDLGEVGRGWSFSFKPDAVLRHRGTGTVWLWDHKTKGKGTFARVEPWTELHMQTLLYVRALRDLGVWVEGAVLYAVLAEEPTIPTLRKDGHLAERGWATDWPTAVDVILGSADPDPDSPRYDALRRACAEREWQMPQEVRFTATEVEGAWSHLLDARDELARARVRAAKKSLDTRRPLWWAVHPSGRGSACGSCEMLAWCREDFEGRDPENLVGSAYVRGASKYLAEVALTRPREDISYQSPGELNGIDKARAR